VPLFSDPKIRDALLTFAEHYPTLSQKYFTNHRLTSGPLFRHSTLLHGDFHLGNLFFETESKDSMKLIKNVYVIDWQHYGIGHPSTEFVFFLSWTKPDEDSDLKLMKVYYEELTKKISPEIYPWKVFERECEIRTLGLAVSVFNMYTNTPENAERISKLLSRNGVDLSQIAEVRLTCISRLANVVEKWKKEKIFENVDKLT